MSSFYVHFSRPLRNAKAVGMFEIIALGPFDGEFRLTYDVIGVGRHGDPIAHYVRDTGWRLAGTTEDYACVRVRFVDEDECMDDSLDNMVEQTEARSEHSQKVAGALVHYDTWKDHVDSKEGFYTAMEILGH
jgi:hypothetical protein